MKSRAICGEYATGLGRRLLEQRSQELGSCRCTVCGNDFRRSAGDDSPTAAAPFRPEIDHEVRAPDYIKVVLDDDHRVALVNEFVEHVQQLARVLEMKTRRRFVENIERSPCAAPREFAGKFYALRFASA